MRTELVEFYDFAQDYLSCSEDELHDLSSKLVNYLYDFHTQLKLLQHEDGDWIRVADSWAQDRYHVWKNGRCCIGGWVDGCINELDSFSSDQDEEEDSLGLAVSSERESKEQILEIHVHANKLVRPKKSGQTGAFCEEGS